MDIHISLRSHKATIVVREDSVKRASLECAIDNNLSAVLLENVESLLRSCGVRAVNINRVTFSSQEAGFTSERIGRTIANAYNFVLDSQRARKSTLNRI